MSRHSNGEIGTGRLIYRRSPSIVARFPQPVLSLPRWSGQVLPGKPLGSARQKPFELFLLFHGMAAIGAIVAICLVHLSGDLDLVCQLLGVFSWAGWLEAAFGPDRWRVSRN
jgi:hypothetical protein